MKTYITILEHDRLYPANKDKVAGTSDGKKHYIDNESFDALKAFVSYERNHHYLDIIQGGKALQARQYVGVIETNKGTVIEILPKIVGTESSKEKTRQIFLKMLRRLKHSPFKHLNSAHLKTDKMHLLDIFISMFNEELSSLIRKGIASDYISKEENSTFIKGKLKIKEQLQKNLTHEERFFIAYDSYETNRIENRLIKSTLEFLIKHTSSSINKRRLREFLFVFGEVRPAKDPKNNFSEVDNGRLLKHYETILKWCELFLNNKSFVGFKGNDVAFTLLFDMNRIFEDYVAYKMKKQYPNTSIKTQHTSEHLLSEPQKQFRLRPDIMIGEEAIGDMKWKLINSSKRNYGLSQSDLYQMFAYGKKYKRQKLYLIYPKSDDFISSQVIPFEYEEGMPLQLLCFDCEKGRLVNFEFKF